LFFGLFSQTALSGKSPREVVITKDIVYSHVEGEQLKLDIGRPAGEGPFPAVVFFHGGGWQQGDKWHMHKWIRKVVPAGYVGVSVAYRFAPEYKWPSQVEDAKAAIRFLRAHANEYNINEHKISVMGESAGGYLALMVGLTSPKDSLEGKSEFGGVPSNVQAVVSFFSATDFSQPRQELSPELQQEMQKYYNKSLEEVRTDFTGTADAHDPRLATMSVISYVDANDPPVLIFHGDRDPFVSVEHAAKLRDKLQAANVAHEMVIVKGGGHGWTGPAEERTTAQMMKFLDAILK
jgi:acetyl esterase/lipase